MKKGYICVAGVDVETRAHVRPVLAGAQQLSTALVARNGGPFDMACKVDLGPIKHVGSAPETEDYRFDPQAARHIAHVPPVEFSALLRDIAETKLSRLFGPELKARGPRSAGVDLARGTASLGCLIPQGRPRLYLHARVDKPDQVRMTVSDGDLDLDLGVTDIRLYGDDHVTPAAATVKQVAQRIAKGEGIVLSVGLTGPFSTSSNYAPVHWLQVNNINLEADSSWRLG